jgi:hypothetical protein
MSEPNIYIAILAGIALLVTFPVSGYAFFKSFGARNISDHVKYGLLFVVPILITFGLAELAGITELPTYPDEPREIPPASLIFSKLNTWQIGFIACAAITWIGGLNVLLNFHRKRTGKPWWVMINPFSPMFRDFDRSEWKIFAGLLIVSLAFGVAALSA